MTSSHRIKTKSKNVKRVVENDWIWKGSANREITITVSYFSIGDNVSWLLLKCLKINRLQME